MAEKLRISLFRKFLTAVDTAATSHLYRWKGTDDLVAELFDPKSGKREKLRVLLNLSGKIIPGIEEIYAQLFTTTQNFPFKNAENGPLICINRSGASTVFLFQPEKMSGDNNNLMVLKIIRESIGLPRDGQLELIASMQRENNIIKNWFMDVPDFIPPDNILIMHSHLFSLPTVAIIQPYLTGNLDDLFEDFKEDELYETINKNSFMKTQFIRFGARVKKIYQDTSACIDLAGTRNICIQRNQSGSQLVLLDPYVIYTRERIAKHPDADSLRTKLEERIGIITALVDRL